MAYLCRVTGRPGETVTLPTIPSCTLKKMAEGSRLAVCDSGSDVQLQQLLQRPVFTDTPQLASL